MDFTMGPSSNVAFISQHKQTLWSVYFTSVSSLWLSTVNPARGCHRVTVSGRAACIYVQCVSVGHQCPRVLSDSLKLFKCIFLFHKTH